MTKVTIPKTEYQKILKTQEKLLAQVAALQKLVIETAKDELKPSVIKRLEQASLAIERGEGKRFRSPSALRVHLKQL